MATTFDVTPRELQQSAGNIENRLREFVGSFNNIYSATTDLKVQYQGASSDAFNQRIEGYRVNFQAAEKTLREYIDFLNRYAAEMSRTEGELTGRAGQLSTGPR